MSTCCPALFLPRCASYELSEPLSRSPVFTPVRHPGAPARWSVEGVQEWLGALGLRELYGGAFESNEISGPVLLEIGLDDLDYMEVRVLAHRKLLLKGVNDLKKHGRPTVDLPRVASSSQAAVTQAPSSPAKAVKTPAPSGGAEAKEGGRVHWSQAKPLSENKVDGSADTGMVNLSDGYYDEAAAAREFQEAVLAWRSGGDSESSGSSGSGSSGSSGSATSGAGKSKGASAGTEFGFGPETDGEKDSGMWVAPWAAEAKDSASQQGGSLLDGNYDEAAAAREFQEALAAWRGGGAANPSSSSSGTGVGMGAPRRDATKVAEALAKELDAGFGDHAKELAEQRQGEAVERMHYQHSPNRSPPEHVLTAPNVLLPLCLGACHGSSGRGAFVGAARGPLPGARRDAGGHGGAPLRGQGHGRRSRGGRLRRRLDGRLWRPR